jgi:HSP20 family protein
VFLVYYVRMPKKFIVATKEEIAPPPPPEPEPEPEDIEEEEGDPVLNLETGTIEQLTVVPRIADETSEAPVVPEADEAEWMAEEFTGQLSVDVYQTEQELVIVSAIAGVRSEDLDIQVTNDMVTIKGIRRLDERVPEENYFTRECYWGRFSRSIILPVDVRNDQVAASIKNGVLVIRLPKIEPKKVTVVNLKE